MLHVVDPTATPTRARRERFHSAPFIWWALGLALILCLPVTLVACPFAVSSRLNVVAVLLFAAVSIRAVCRPPGPAVGLTAGRPISR